MEKPRKKRSHLAAAAIASVAGVTEVPAVQPVTSVPVMSETSLTGTDKTPKRILESKKEFLDWDRNDTDGKALRKEDVVIREHVAAFNVLGEEYRSVHEEVLGLRSLPETWARLTASLEPGVENTEEVQRKIKLEGRVMQLLVHVANDVSVIQAVLGVDSLSPENELRKFARQRGSIVSVLEKWKEFKVLVGNDAELHNMAFAKIIEYQEWLQGQKKTQT